MTEQLNCTFCSAELGAVENYEAGDSVACDECNVSFDLVREDDTHDLVTFDCPYCGYGNKRDKGVVYVVCEDEDCGLRFDPAGADVGAVDESNVRMKMEPQINNY